MATKQKCMVFAWYSRIILATIVLCTLDRLAFRKNCTNTVEKKVVNPNQLQAGRTRGRIFPASLRFIIYMQIREVIINYRNKF